MDGIHMSTEHYGNIAFCKQISIGVDHFITKAYKYGIKKIFKLVLLKSDYLFKKGRSGLKLLVSPIIEL